MELDQEACGRLSSASAGAAVALPVAPKKERSSISLAITYGLIGLLLGAIVISALAS